MAARKRPAAKVLPEIQKKDELDDLLVFGYQCKLFRDDERAISIDEGRHLIPWMGDSRLQIDRYDCRGFLHDLEKHDVDYLTKECRRLSDEEQRIEALCDEERYLALHTDLTEKAYYEEEELKRLNLELNDEAGYKAMGFSYDQQYDPSEPTAEQQPAETEEQENESDEDNYETPPELKVPPGVHTPSSCKMVAIMEKTAKFVCEHGTQMEIVLKTKQKNNSQFNFLEFGDVYNPFYKHMVKMMKAGKYQPRMNVNTKPKKRLSEESHHESEDEQDHHGYLHPSLRSSNATDNVDNSGDNMLSIIQSRLPSGQIANTSYAKLISMVGKQTGRLSPAGLPYAHTSKLAEDSGTTASTYAPIPPPPLPPGMTQPSDVVPSVAPYIAQEGSLYTPAQPGLPPPPGMEPVTLPSNNHGQPPPPGTVPPEPLPSLPSDSQLPETSESMDVQGPHIIPPPPDAQPVIDKMASYVAKNGPEFESIVRNKGGDRFAFLQSWHIHNAYYEYKKCMYQEELLAEDDEMALTGGGKKSSGLALNKSSSAYDKMQPPKAVSFSIKTKDSEGGQLEKRTAFPMEESSDEEGDRDGSERRERSDRSDSDSRNDFLEEMLDQRSSEDRYDKPERPQLSVEELERRQAEERLKDKLALAAREKLVQAGKEKQLQAERKRRAAMFISMLKGPQPSGRPEVEPYPVPAPAAAQGPSATVTSPIVSPFSSRSSSPLTVLVPEKRSRTRSPSRSSKSPSQSRSSKSHKPRRSRSRSPRPRRRSRSPIIRRRSKTPPSAYSVVRRSRSRSPLKRRRGTRSKSKERERPREREMREREVQDRNRERDRGSSKHKKKSRKSRSKSRSPSGRKKSKKSGSPTKTSSRKSSSPKVPSSRTSRNSTPHKSDKTETTSPKKHKEDQDSGSSKSKSQRSPSRPSGSSHTDTTSSSLEQSSSSAVTGNVPKDLLSKVRAMLKATREANKDS